MKSPPPATGKAHLDIMFPSSLNQCNIYKSNGLVRSNLTFRYLILQSTIREVNRKKGIVMYKRKQNDRNTENYVCVKILELYCQESQLCHFIIRVSRPCFAFYILICMSLFMDVDSLFKREGLNYND